MFYHLRHYALQILLTTEVIACEVLERKEKHYRMFVAIANDTRGTLEMG